MKKHFTLDQNDETPDKETEHQRKYEAAGPSQKALNNIMSYSRSLMVIKTKLSGNVNLILN
jgi:hypothetical protein